MSTTTPPVPEQKAEPYKRYGSCGAPINHQPTEGEGLPCGH